MDIGGRRNILGPQAASIAEDEGFYSVERAERPILITGASGRLGRVLRAAWPARLAGLARPLWQSRGGAVPGAVVWDPLAGPYRGPALAGGAILHLAGGRIDAAATVALARAVCDLARRQGAALVLLASSSAVYGPGEDLAEEAPLRPAGDYGAAKRAMEAAVAGRPGVTCLRIGNVLGADALIGAAVPGRPVTLDPVPGHEGGPVRSYIGPLAFAEVLARLCLRGIGGAGALPPVLNLAAAPPVAMGALLDAAGLPWAYGPPNPGVVARVTLDVARLAALVGAEATAATPAGMVAEWRRGTGGAA